MCIRDRWYTPQVFDLAGLCRKLHRETDLLVESVGAQLSYQEDQSSVLVKGEEQLLSTLIYHLIANALYCLKGKGGEICLKLSRHGSQVLVTVEDKDVYKRQTLSCPTGTSPRRTRTP